MSVRHAAEKCQDIFQHGIFGSHRLLQEHPFVWNYFENVKTGANGKAEWSCKNLLPLTVVAQA